MYVCMCLCVCFGLRLAVPVSAGVFSSLHVSVSGMYIHIPPGLPGPQTRGKGKTAKTAKLYGKGNSADTRDRLARLGQTGVTVDE